MVKKVRKNKKGEVLTIFYTTSMPEKLKKQFKMACLRREIAMSQCFNELVEAFVKKDERGY